MRKDFMIIDAFIFYNELALLELRFRELYEVVDWFVIVEATRTFRGDPKPLFFSDAKDRYRQYLSKVIHIVVDDMPMNTDAWGRESHQRNAIKRGIETLDPSDDSMLLLSDVDEIPDPKGIPTFPIDQPYALEQDFYYYNFTWKHREPWTSARCLSVGQYKRLGCNIEHIRTGCLSLPRIPYAGWHFSYFGDISFIRRKLESFSHQEFNVDTFKTTEHLDECLRTGQDLFFRHDKSLLHVPVEINPYLPTSMCASQQGPLTIAFFIRHFTERGTEVSAYDYAHYNETILGNKSIVIGLTPDAHARKSLPFVPEVLDKFQRRFPVFLVNHFSEIDSLLRRERADIYYTQTHGGIERPPYGDITACTYAVHCVFEPRVPHGDIYFAISQQLNDRFGTSIPVVPYIVHRGTSTDTLRAALKIPEDAIVFGRHGGYDTFDNPIVRSAVVDVASSNPSIYFLLMNTPVFCNLPNVIHLPTTIDAEAKQTFINTCDAYLHGRCDGETFGLSVGEFAVSDKPILACTRCTDDAHLRILGNKVYRFTTKEDLLTILRTFRRGEMDMTTNGYKQYTAERVMEQFQQIVCKPRFHQVRVPASQL